MSKFFEIINKNKKFFFTLNLFFLIYGVLINFYILYILLFFFFIFFYKKVKKIIFLIFAYTFLSFFIFDISDFKNEEINNYRIESQIEYEIDKNYGYYPKKNSSLEENIYFKNKLIKKINYNINRFGHREIENINSSKKCIIFHGGSFTFGQTLNNSETLPYYIKEILMNNYNIYNYAFNGYGAHQFLSKVENNYLDEVMHCKDVIITYQFIPDHIARSAGKRSWGDRSPRYILINDDEIKQNGFFSHFPFKIIMKLRKNVRNSKFLSLIFNLDKVSKKDEIVFLNIIKKIEKLSEKKFQKVQFIYLFWEAKDKLKYKKIYNYFLKSNFINISSLNIKEEYKKNLIPGDNHPTKEYNLILANEVIKKISE